MDLENYLTSTLLLAAAGRFEYYDDFGSTLTGKLSTRFEPIPGYAIRASINNGFKAFRIVESRRYIKQKKKKKQSKSKLTCCQNQCRAASL